MGRHSVVRMILGQNRFFETTGDTVKGSTHFPYRRVWHETCWSHCGSGMLSIQDSSGAMGSIETKNARYAVIQARWYGRAPECFPIAYSDEQALRAIIAGSCILACDIASHDEAIAVVQSSSLLGCPTQRGSATGIGKFARLRRSSCRNQKEEKKIFFGLGKVRGAISQLTRQGFTAALVVIFAKNAVCGLLRAFIGI